MIYLGYIKSSRYPELLLQPTIISEITVFGRMSLSFYLVARQVVVGLIWLVEVVWFSLTLIGTLPMISRLILMHLMFITS